MDLPIYFISDIHLMLKRGESELKRQDILFKFLNHVKKTGGTLIINGDLFEESYLSNGILTEVMYEYARDFTLSGDQYFLLGDNRPVSVDSRIYGAVEEDRLLGMIYP